MNPAEFNALISKVKKDDKRATEIFAKYCVSASRLRISAKFSNPQDAEDWAYGVVFDRILYNLPAVYIQNPLAWIYKITDNYVYNKLKAENRLVGFDESICADNRFAALFDKIEVEDAIRKYDEETRDILMLYCFYGYTFKEIAEIMHIKYANLRQKMCRIRKIAKTEVTKRQ